METVIISKEEYTRLKRKAKIADNALVQLELSLNDLKEGNVTKL